MATNQQYQQIQQYDKDAAKRYIELIKSQKYLERSSRIAMPLTVNDLSHSKKKRIRLRSQQFDISPTGYCATCLERIPNPPYKLIKSDVFCCGNCRYIAKKIREEFNNGNSSNLV
jgi:hypothetical protein